MVAGSTPAPGAKLMTRLKTKVLIKESNDVFVKKRIDLKRGG